MQVVKKIKNNKFEGLSDLLVFSGPPPRVWFCWVMDGLSPDPERRIWVRGSRTQGCAWLCALVQTLWVGLSSSFCPYSGPYTITNPVQTPVQEALPTKIVITPENTQSLLVDLEVTPTKPPIVDISRESTPCPPTIDLSRDSISELLFSWSVILQRVSLDLTTNDIPPPQEILWIPLQGHILRPSSQTGGLWSRSCSNLGYRGDI